MPTTPDSSTGDASSASAAARFLNQLKLTSTDALKSDPNEVFVWADELNFGKNSPPFALGYSPGSSKVNSSNRRIVLSAVLKAQLGEGDALESEAHGWGHPCSAQRLFALSQFLVWMVNAYKESHQAIAKRIVNDLQWLRGTHFVEEMRFEWPSAPFVALPATRPLNAAFTLPMIPSKELAVIVGNAPLPRTEVVSRVWAYIKKNGLQRRDNKRLIHCDENLKRIFAKSEISMFEMAGAIGRHMTRP